VGFQPTLPVKPPILQGLDAGPLMWTAAIAGLAAIVAVFLKAWVQAGALVLLAVLILVLPELLNRHAAMFLIPAAVLATAWGAMLLLRWWLNRRGGTSSSPGQSDSASEPCPSSSSTPSQTSAPSEPPSAPNDN